MNNLSNSQPATLSLNHVSFERNDEVILHKLNLSISSGELLQVKGNNGSGKSTLLRILLGLIEPTQGTILWKNQPIAKQRETYKHELHYLGHQNGIKANLTVLENLQLFYSLFEKKISLTSILRVLQKLNLETVLHHLALHLSAGQMRRLSFARFLLISRPLWILDEPLTALDNQGQLLLQDMLNNHLSTGGMAIVATHQDLTYPQSSWLDLNENTHD